MNQFIISPEGKKQEHPNKDNITLIYQYDNVKDPIKRRNQRYNLRLNVENEFISKIILLNKKIFTGDELGIDSKKIKQVKLGKKVTYKDVFNQVHGDGLKGYVIISNSNTFFDKSIENIYHSGMADNKLAHAPLNYIYSGDKRLAKCKMFPRADHNPVIIYHSNFNVEKKMRKAFNIEIDIRNNNYSCKMLYLLNAAGYDMVNDPYFIRNYMNCNVKQIKNEAKSSPDNSDSDDNLDEFDAEEYDDDKTILYDEIKSPFMYLIPAVKKQDETASYPLSQYLEIEKKSFKDYTLDGKLFNNDSKEFNDMLYDSIKNDTPLMALTMNKHSIDILYHISEINESQLNEDEFAGKIAMSNFAKSITELNNGGININTEEEVQLYSKIFIQILQVSSVVFNYTVGMDVFNNSMKSHLHILKTLNGAGKKIMDRSTISPINKHNNTSWAEIVKNKKILILSNHQEELNNQREKFKDIYENNYFENCEFITCNLPNHKKDDGVDLNQYLSAYFNFITEQLGEKINEIDMILIGDTPHNIFILNYFYKHGKIVLDVGEYLELFFGIYTEETLEKYGDYINLYKNKNWVRAEK